MDIKNRVWVLLCLTFTSCQTSQFTSFTKYESVKNKTVVNQSAVVSAHPLASAAGAYAFAKGGNAFDAAIATQWALAVVYPNAGNIGGGGFLVAHTADGTDLTLDYRERAPAKSSRDMYLDADGNAQTEWSQEGILAVGVPGSVSGMFEALAYAKLPMKVLIAPAIQLAEKGFAITEQQANTLNSHKEIFEKLNKDQTAFTKKEVWNKGDILVQTNLAHTLKRIQKNGLKEFYEGETATLLVQEMKTQKGIISMEDLKNYKTVRRKPLLFQYKGYDIVSMPPPSSGGVLLAQMLGMTALEGLGADGQNTPATVQLMIEAERRAYADRAEYLGDPDFVKIPVKTLISKDYLARRMQNYQKSKASPSSEIASLKIPYESDETTHISVLDKDGNAVSITTTLNGNFGSGVVVKNAGFVLNNEMDDFSIKPGMPNMYGAIGGEANAIAPQKRMLSSMAPTLVLKNKKPFIVVGTPGGTTIPTSVFQTLLNVIDFKTNAYDAVNSPKFHFQWLPDEVKVENDFPQSTIEALKKMNYTFKSTNGIGRTELIIKKENGLDIAADKRGDDAIATY